MRVEIERDRYGRPMVKPVVEEIQPPIEEVIDDNEPIVEENNDEETPPTDTLGE